MKQRIVEINSPNASSTPTKHPVEQTPPAQQDGSGNLAAPVSISNLTQTLNTQHVTDLQAEFIAQLPQEVQEAVRQDLLVEMATLVKPNLVITGKQQQTPMDTRSAPTSAVQNNQPATHSAQPVKIMYPIPPNTVYMEGIQFSITGFLKNNGSRFTSALNQLAGGTVKAVKSTRTCVRITCSDDQQVKRLLGTHIHDFDNKTVKFTLPHSQTGIQVESVRTGAMGTIYIDPSFSIPTIVTATGAKSAHRRTQRKDGQTTDTHIVVLEFQPGVSMPEKVKIQYYFYKVRHYIPDPIRCNNCQSFGHTLTHCKRDTRCPRCAGPHKYEECRTNTRQCVNCKLAHSSSYGGCPEKAIHQLAISKRQQTPALKYQEAVKAARDEITAKQPRPFLPPHRPVLMEFQYSAAVATPRPTTPINQDTTNNQKQPDTDNQPTPVTIIHPSHQPKRRNHNIAAQMASQVTNTTQSSHSTQAPGPSNQANQAEIMGSIQQPDTDTSVTETAHVRQIPAPRQPHRAELTLHQQTIVNTVSSRQLNGAQLARRPPLLQTPSAEQIKERQRQIDASSHQYIPSANDVSRPYDYIRLSNNDPGNPVENDFNLFNLTIHLEQMVDTIFYLGRQVVFLAQDQQHRMQHYDQRLKPELHRIADLCGVKWDVPRIS
jgi:hypothetical protein